MIPYSSRSTKKLVRRFEHSWSNETPQAIERFLPPSENRLYLPTLAELVIIEMEFLWKNRGQQTVPTAIDGQPCVVESYLRRFPKLNEPAVVVRLVKQEFQVRNQFADQPQLTEFRQRFPQLTTLMTELLALTVEQPTGDLRDTPSTVGTAVDLRSRLESTAYRLEPGTRIDRYSLVKKLGEGGMGEVWMAEQSEPVRRAVALKVVKHGLDSTQILARFEAERQALALMDHPNIAKVLDGGETSNGQPYFVMELVDGVPFTNYCDRERLPIRQRLELFILVCQAVQHAHQKGIIHRDLKPSNVLVAKYDDKPIPKVIDFGVAKAVNQRLTERTLDTNVGQIVGTLYYMPPEQAELTNVDVDTRADVYALGVVLYELLTSTTPFAGPRLRDAGLYELLRIIREFEPPKPSARLSSSESLPAIAANRSVEPARLPKLVSGELDWIAMKCLEKDRGRRYETASAMALDVHRYLVDEPVEAGPPSAGYRMRKFVKRNRGAVLASAGLLLTLVAGIAGTTYGLFEAWSSAEFAKGQEKRADGEARNAKTQQGIADENAREASDQRKLALETLRGVINDIHARLKDAPAQQELRQKVLANALAGLKKVARNAETSARADREQIWVYLELGDILRELGADGTEEAGEQYKRGLDLATRLGDANPEDAQAQRDLSVALMKFGDLDLQRGDAKSALTFYRRSLEIDERLVAEDELNLRAQRDLSLSLDKIGDAHSKAGEFKSALAVYRRSRSIREKLTKDRPENSLFERDLSAAFDKIGDIHMRLNDPNAALADYDRSLEISQKQVQTEPNNAHRRSAAFPFRF